MYTHTYIHIYVHNCSSAGERGEIQRCNIIIMRVSPGDIMNTTCGKTKLYYMMSKPDFDTLNHHEHIMQYSTYIVTNTMLL